MLRKLRLDVRAFQRQPDRHVCRNRTVFALRRRKAFTESRCVSRWPDASRTLPTSNPLCVVKPPPSGFGGPFTVQ